MADAPDTSGRKGVIPEWGKWLLLACIVLTLGVLIWSLPRTPVAGRLTREQRQARDAVHAAAQDARSQFDAAVRGFGVTFKPSAAVCEKSPDTAFDSASCNEQVETTEAPVTAETASGAAAAMRTLEDAAVRHGWDAERHNVLSNWVFHRDEDFATWFAKGMLEAHYEKIVGDDIRCDMSMTIGSIGGTVRGYIYCFQMVDPEGLPQGRL